MRLLQRLRGSLGGALLGLGLLLVVWLLDLGGDDTRELRQDLTRDGERSDEP